MFEQLFNNPFLYSLSLTLVHFLWQGLLVGLILKSALLIIDKSKSKLRYGLATFSMLANLIVVIVTFVMVYPDGGTRINSNLSPIPLNSLVNQLTQKSTMLAYQELIPSILAYVLPCLAILWLATITMLAGKLLIEVRNVNRLPLQASTSPSSALLARFNELAKQLKLLKTPKLLISLKAEVPMAIGWLKPVVLLPASMVTGLDAAQLEMLLLHELAHIRRHDYLVNFLQTLIELLLFFHPSVHWIGKQMRNEREYCSDDVAVQHSGDAIAYAHTLTDTASLCAKKHVHTIPTMAMAASGGDLKARVIRLVDHHCAPSNDTGKWLAAFSLLLVLSLLSINQLLTMPFSYHLHNQFPWYQSNAHSNKVTQHSSISNQISNQISSKGEVTSVVNNSIAIQLLSNKEGLTNNPFSADQSDRSIEAKTTIVPIPALLAAETIESNLNILEVVVKSEPSNIILHTNNELPREKFKASKAGQIVNLQSKKNDLILKPTKISQLIEIAAPRLITPPHEPIAPTKLDSLVYIAEANDIEQTGEQSSVSTQLVQGENINSQSPVVLMNQAEHKNRSNSKLSYSQEIDKFELQNALYKASQPLPTKVRIKTVKSYDAKLLNSTSPVYPILAKRRRIEMQVKVNFTIDRNGRVKDIKFGSQNRIAYFKASIRSAIRKWRFTPAVKNNDIIESRMSKIFSFSLQS